MRIQLIGRIDPIGKTCLARFPISELQAEHSSPRREWILLRHCCCRPLQSPKDCAVHDLSHW